VHHVGIFSMVGSDYGSVFAHINPVVRRYYDKKIL